MNQVKELTQSIKIDVAQQLNVFQTDKRATERKAKDLQPKGEP